MNREQYLNYRNNSDLYRILYQYFIEESKVSLNFETFVHLFNFWRHGERIIKDVLLYYDLKFDIVVLSQQNKVILYL